MYKAKLQELCQKKRWGLPKYTSIRDGPDHNPRFRASVVVNGVTFDTPFASTSSKDAHNEAAKIASLHFTCASSDNEILPRGPKVGESHEGQKIHSKTSGFQKSLKEAELADALAPFMSLSPDTFQQNDSCSYKNLLQEYAQKEGRALPTYETIRSGELPHPNFYSSVEVEGEIFHGNAAKTKKQAEFNSAKAAYTALMERKYTALMERSGKLSQNSDFTSPTLSEDRTQEFTPHSGKLMVANPQGGKLMTSRPLVLNPTTKQSVDEYQEIVSADVSSVNVEVSPQNGVASPAPAVMDDISGHRHSHSLKGVLHSSTQEGYASPTVMTPSDLSDLSVAESKVGKTMGIKSYLLCNRVRVYTSIPDMKLPEGTVVLPISDDKWVVVSLEFPIKEDA